MNNRHEHAVCSRTLDAMWFAEVSIQHLRVEEARRVDFQF